MDLTRGGAKGTRTPNPLLAKQVRYLLRHGPGSPGRAQQRPDRRTMVRHLIQPNQAHKSSPTQLRINCLDSASAPAEMPTDRTSVTVCWQDIGDTEPPIGECFSMGTKEVTMEIKYAAVFAIVQGGGESVTSVCDRLQISRKSYYKYRARFECEGLEGVAAAVAAAVDESDRNAGTDGGVDC